MSGRQQCGTTGSFHRRGSVCGRRGGHRGLILKLLTAQLCLSDGAPSSVGEQREQLQFHRRAVHVATGIDLRAGLYC